MRICFEWVKNTFHKRVEFVNSFSAQANQNMAKESLESSFGILLYLIISASFEKKKNSWISSVHARILFNRFVRPLVLFVRNANSSFSF